MKKEKIYVCECGKEFTNPQSFNGHKSSCKIHFAAVGKDITKSSLYNQEAQRKAHETIALNKAKKHKQELDKWIAEQHICEHCGKIMTEKFGSGRFCSRACANARQHSEETRKKLAKAATKKKSDLSKNIRIATVIRKPVELLDLSKRTVSKVLIRMKLPCSCCGAYVPGVVWDIHHIIPSKKGGSDSADNLTYICPNCHRISHTDISLLKKPLVPLTEFLAAEGKNWRDYYFIKLK